MHKSSYHVLLSFILFALLISNNIKAQNKSFWELNYNIGTSVFLGDIKQNQWLPANDEWRLGTGVQFGKQISYVFGIRGQLLYGQMAGKRTQWNRYFQSEYFETNVNATVSLNNLFGTKRSDRLFNIYLIGGIGVTQYNTSVYELGTNKFITRVGKGGVNGNGTGFGGRTLEGILTAGMGIDFRINDNIHINFESVHRGMNSDAFDAWEKGFPYDIYNYTSIGVSWRIVMQNRKQKVETINQARPQEIKQVFINHEETVPDTIEQVVIRYVKYVEPEETAEIKESFQPKKSETILPEQHEVEFRVQILAKLNTSVSINYLSKKYGIPADQIQEGRHALYFTYSVGSFASYEKAQEKRDLIRTKYGISDAFVTAYYKGIRLEQIPK
jgi:hypothetical protein